MLGPNKPRVSRLYRLIINGLAVYGAIQLYSSCASKAHGEELAALNHAKKVESLYNRQGDLEKALASYQLSRANLEYVKR
jgi:hypothetical protein